jgi:tRNA_anti-like
MQLLLIQLFLGLFIFRANTSVDKRESKIFTIDNYEKAGSGITAPHQKHPPAQPPPRPADPPINRKWIVTASKLASDYIHNRLVADRKYKKNMIVVEGIVKEIKVAGEETITITDDSVTVILNGAPSRIDVHCQVLNTIKTKKIKKGMKVTILPGAVSLSSHVILTKCIYIDKPTYE